MTPFLRPSKQTAEPSGVRFMNEVSCIQFKKFREPLFLGLSSRFDSLRKSQYTVVENNNMAENTINNFHQLMKKLLFLALLFLVPLLTQAQDDNLNIKEIQLPGIDKLKKLVSKDELPMIEKLVIQSEELSESDYKVISKMPNLKVLDISGVSRPIDIDGNPLVGTSFDGPVYRFNIQNQPIYNVSKLIIDSRAFCIKEDYEPISQTKCEYEIEKIINEKIIYLEVVGNVFPNVRSLTVKNGFDIKLPFTPPSMLYVTKIGTWQVYISGGSTLEFQHTKEPIPSVPTIEDVLSADTNPYSQQLTATNYMNEPLSLDNSCEEYDGTFLNNRHANDMDDYIAKYSYFSKNIVGDTLFTNGGVYENDFDVEDVYKVDHQDNKIIGFGHGASVTIPRGQYVVTAVLFGDDLRKEMKSFLNNGYKIDKVEYTRNEQLDFLQMLGERYTPLSEIKEKIVEAKINKIKYNFTVSSSYGLRIESIDKTSTYYLSVDSYEYHASDLILTSFVPIKYLDYIKKELLNKTVLMSYRYDFVFDVSSTYKKFKDAITGGTVFQQDTLFYCSDVVINKTNDVCCILEGKNTGKFAVKVTGKYDDLNNSQGISLYKRESPLKKSIWHRYYTSEDVLDSRLAWIKLFVVRGETYDKHIDRYIVKVDDLEKCVKDTEHINALKAMKKSQEQKDYQNEIAKREAQNKQDMIEKYGQDKGSLIAKHTIALGMTPEMCMDAWGRPLSISNMIDSSGQYTEWKYNFKTVIYFKDGKVVRILN